MGIIAAYTSSHMLSTMRADLVNEKVTELKSTRQNYPQSKSTAEQSRIAQWRQLVRSLWKVEDEHFRFNAH
jgi:hypothetical protein